MFRPHNINKDIPPGHTVIKNLVMPKACAKIIQHVRSLHPRINHVPPTGETPNIKYIGINKFYGKNKENVMNWLDHSAAKLQTSRIPHKKWVQEASKRLFDAAANWFATWVNSKTNDQINDWEEFKKDITNNFRVTKSLQDIAIQLSNLPQKTTITAYANKFDKIRHKIQNPAQADNVHTRASFINCMKPSVAALIRPEANTSMPALIAEAKRAEKRANMEYASRNGNRSSISNGRDKANGNKRQNTNGSNTTSNRTSNNNSLRNQSSNCSRPKKEENAEVNNAETVTCYESGPTFSDLEELEKEMQGKEEGDQA